MVSAAFPRLSRSASIEWCIVSHTVAVSVRRQGFGRISEGHHRFWAAAVFPVCLRMLSSADELQSLCLDIKPPYIELLVLAIALRVLFPLVTLGRIPIEDGTRVRLKVDPVRVPG